MISPVDIPQAITGIGMRIFTRYSKVLNPDGSEMTVREALAMIHQVYGEIVAEAVGDVDRQTRLCMAWFEQHGFGAGDYGDAETLAKAFAVAPGDCDGLECAGGRARLPFEPGIPDGWQMRGPISTWRAMLWVGEVLETHGELAAAQHAAAIGGPANPIPLLAEWCYLRTEAAAWRRPEVTPTRAGRRFAALSTSWPEILRLVVSTQQAYEARAAGSARERPRPGR